MFGNPVEVLPSVMPQKVVPGCDAVSPRKFLEKYCLPRVVRLQAQGEEADASLLGGDLLLYTHYTSGKVEARDTGLLVIPDSYLGWFSVVTEKGQVKARCYTSVQRLVQSQVTAFLSMTDLQAYTLANRTNTDGRRQHYSKTVVKGNQVLRLLAVYQDLGSQSNKRLSWPLLAKADRYTQCLTNKDQVVYIPVSAQGQFYCVSGGNPDDTTSRIYQLNRLLSTFPLPVRVVPINGFKTHGSVILENYKKEEVILGCVLPKDKGQFRLVEIDINSKLSVVRPHISQERGLYRSEKVQAALKYCHENWQQWSRQIKIIHHIFPSKKVEPADHNKPTVRSSSFRFSKPRRPLPPPPPPHLYSKVASEAQVVKPSFTVINPSFKTKIFINDNSSEISSEIVDSYFSESNYPLRQELRKKPLYKTRVTIGHFDLPYSTVKDQVQEPSLYAEIDGEYLYPKSDYSTVSISSLSNATSTLS